MPHLKELKLIKNPNLLISNIPTSLAKLTIAHCDKITRIPFGGDSLTCIRLAGFPEIHDMSLLQFKHLFALHLYGFVALDRLQFPTSVKHIRLEVLQMPMLHVYDFPDWDVHISDVFL